MPLLVMSPVRRLMSMLLLIGQGELGDVLVEMILGLRRVSALGLRCVAMLRLCRGDPSLNRHERNCQDGEQPDAHHRLVQSLHAFLR